MVSKWNTHIYDLEGLFDSIEKKRGNKKKFKYTYTNEFLPDNVKIILGKLAAAKYPIRNRKIKDDMYLLSFKNKHPTWCRMWWLFTNCGRSFSRWFFCCLIIVFLFGAVFSEYPVPGIQPEYFRDFLVWLNPKFQVNPARMPTFFTHYYLSIVTFTTLGFGDVIPLNLAGEIWLALEVFFGYIMLGGLISILAAKLARRS